MKLAKYITIAINVILFFTICWILNSVGKDNSENGAYICAISGVIALLAFTINTFSLLGFSIKMFISSFKDWKNERGLWKILNLCFKLAMFLFAILITIFWLVWFIFILKDGFGKHLLLGTDIFANVNKFEQFGIYSYMYINGGDMLDVYNKMGLASSSPFGLYITSFVFILIWSAAGLTFEILKKVLGGNKAKKEETNQA